MRVSERAIGTRARTIGCALPSPALCSALLCCAVLRVLGILAAPLCAPVRLQLGMMSAGNPDCCSRPIGFNGWTLTSPWLAGSRVVGVTGSQRSFRVT